MGVYEKEKKTFYDITQEKDMCFKVRQMGLREVGG